LGMDSATTTSVESMERVGRNLTEPTKAIGVVRAIMPVR
jgi:hypothetical protein